MGVPEGEKREKVAETIFEEIMAKKIPNLINDTNIHIPKKVNEQQERKIQRYPHQHTV